MSCKKEKKINLLICFCLIFCFGFFSACKRSESVPFSVSDQAIKYTFSEDNFLSLKSIITDQEATKDAIILEFDDSSEYIYKDGMEGILKEMEDNPSGYFWKIIGESSDEIINTNIQVMYGKRSIYLILYLEPDVECSNIAIRFTNTFINIKAPWDAPNLELMFTGHTQDGKEGTLFRSQEFDKELMKWKDYIDEFVEDKEPVGD